MAFNRCVTTNEGEIVRDKVHDTSNEVLVTSESFAVDYNYEFLEDFKDKHSSER